MAQNDIARVYATSLVELGTDKNVLPQLEEELVAVKDLLADADVNRFLTSPGFPR